MSVCLTITPTEFFRTHLTDAASELKIELPDNLEFYLVKLLCDFINPDKLKTNAEELDVLNTPLALILKKAMESPPEQKLKLYKNMADTSLYISGYFQDYFNRKMFNLSYYVDMGKNAYHCLSDIMENHHGDRHFSEIYKLLGNQFDQFVEILATISENTDPRAGDTGTLELYDRWAQTGSERLRKELGKRGIDPVVVPINKAQ